MVIKNDDNRSKFMEMDTKSPIFLLTGEIVQITACGICMCQLNLIPNTCTIPIAIKNKN